MQIIRNIIILFFLTLIACSPLKKYEQLPEVKAWQPEIARFEDLDKTENYPDHAIVFAGSSSIRLWSTIAEDMSPYKVIQRGYGGAKFSDFAVYADRIFSPHKCSGLGLFFEKDITGEENDKKPGEVKK